MYALILVFLALRPADEIALDPSARAIFEMLIRKAGPGFSHIEEAAFIVRDGGGHLAAIPWPSDGEPDSGRWEGAYPAGTIAIVHTHPNWLPLPSRIDAATARRAHVPVYVITLSGISKTTGGEPLTVIAGDWESLNAAPGSRATAAIRSTAASPALCSNEDQASPSVVAPVGVRGAW